MDIGPQGPPTVVQQLSTGRAKGQRDKDDLPAEFYKQFWEIMGADLHEVFTWSINNGKLPTSCTWAVLSWLTKKGDLGVLRKLETCA